MKAKRPFVPPRSCRGGGAAPESSAALRCMQLQLVANNRTGCKCRAPSIGRAARRVAQTRSLLRAFTRAVSEALLGVAAIPELLFARVASERTSGASTPRRTTIRRSVEAPAVRASALFNLLFARVASESTSGASPRRLSQMHECLERDTHGCAILCNPFAHTSARSARSLAGLIPTIRPSSARTQPTCAQRSCSLLCCKGTDSARTHAVFFSTLGERSARRYKCSRSPSTPAHPSPEVGHDSCGGGSSMLCGTFSQHTRRGAAA